ncbi:ankyrin repeat domain-containing protein [Wolbachia endosymbiont (group B) of Carcina quercana]|uniref:ankyrin repeat domain-containing protein n=1 Tax=Wolbachia endosymbiont (group B) of Carcina quercana TaxID=2953992 RepID=UPI002220EE97|nr:ankyrin repeat domain-containing protein [Wolbachia endosymbiont (group B) of Carcina quercana]
MPTNPDVNYRTSGNTNGNTPLRFAVRSGNLAEVKILLKKGADVNAKDETYFMTPLHCAAASGHKEIVELLIEKGAEPESALSGVTLDNQLKGRAASLPY